MVPPLNTEQDLVAEDAGPDPVVLRALATSMSADEDLTIFRRFGEANLLNLLVLQEETQKLFNEFKNLCPEKIERADRRGTSGGYIASYILPNDNPPVQSENDEEVGAKRRISWKKLKKKLKEYSELTVDTF